MPREIGLQALAVLLFCSATASATTVIYPAPAGASLSPDYSITVNGQPISVYSFFVQTQRYSFAYFDFSGTANVSVTIASPLMNNPVIRPLSKGIAYTLSGNTVSFSLASPANLSIEPINGNIIDATPLLLFANPLEVNAPKQGDPGVIYYGPGYYNAGTINLTSNQTLYIAGGALVQGNIVASGSNITVRGRGILDGGGVYGSRSTTQLFYAHDSTNLSVEGIILKDSTVWTFYMSGNDYVTVNNLKIISAVGPVYHDGMDIDNTSHVTIQDSFILSDDDTFQIGNQSFATGDPPVDTISATRTVLWSNANNWRIGWVAQGPYISNLTFTDMDILHRAGYNRVVTVEASGNGTVGTPETNFLFQNIRIDADYAWTGDFIELQPQVWGSDGALGPPGSIQTVKFQDIFLNGYQNPSTVGTMLVSGPAANEYVNDVTFNNVVRYGQVATAASPNVSITGYTSNIVFNGSTSGGTAPAITSALSASAAAGAAFSYQITASNSPTSFNATGLPAGLSVNTGTGLISGTPTATGSSNVAISATNAGGTGSATLTLTVNASASQGLPIQFTSATLPETHSVVIPLTVPANATAATLQLTCFDCDHTDFGNLVINGGAPMAMWVPLGVSNATAVLNVPVALSSLINGNNNFTFTKTGNFGGGTVSAIAATFTVPTQSIPPAAPGGLHIL